MSTPLSNFREPVRVLIGDNDADIKLREDFQLDAGMRTVLKLGKVEGYTADSQGANTSPDLDPAKDPAAFARLVYHTAKLFVVDITPVAWRTRAFSESIGENKELLFSLLEEIYRLDHGDECGSNNYS